jgi:hypothetical protein
VLGLLAARNFVEDVYRPDLRNAFQKKDDQEAREPVCKSMAAGEPIELPENSDNPKYNPAKPHPQPQAGSAPDRRKRAHGHKPRYGPGAER